MKGTGFKNIYYFKTVRLQNTIVRLSVFPILDEYLRKIYLIITYVPVCALWVSNNKTTSVNIILNKNRSKVKKLNVRDNFLKKLSLKRHLKVRRVYNVFCVISPGRFYFSGVGILFFSLAFFFFTPL